MDIIDQLIEGISKLSGSPQSDGTKTVEHPPPIPHIEGMVPCQWYTVYDGKKAEEIDLFAGDEGKYIEVRVDGNIEPRRLSGIWQTFKGKKIEVHLIPNKDFPTGDVGHRVHPH